MSKADGNVLLVAHPLGQVPVEKNLGRLDLDHDAKGIVAREPATKAGVRILDRGAVSARHVVQIVDLSRGCVQPSVRTKTDAEGELGTAWLVGDRRYRFVVTGDGVPDRCVNVDGFRPWVGQPEIDMSKRSTGVDQSALSCAH